MRATISTVFLVIGLLLYYLLSPTGKPFDRDAIRASIAKLTSDLEVEKAKCHKAIHDYKPLNPKPINSREFDLLSVLRGLPLRLSIELLYESDKAEGYIVHIRDWHLVNRDLFNVDQQIRHDKSLNQADLDLLFEKHMLEVALAQEGQIACLKCLSAYHGLTDVFSEGFASSEVNAFEATINALKAIETQEMPEVFARLKEIRELENGLAGEELGKAKTIEASLQDLIDKHRLKLLEIGAVGRLLISGDLRKVLPLEGEEGLILGEPDKVSLKLAPKKVKERQDLQVRELMKSHQSVIFLILGGEHDLSQSIKKLLPTRGYIRFQTGF